MLVNLALSAVSQAAVTCISVGVALTTFVGILLQLPHLATIKRRPKLEQKVHQSHHHEGSSLEEERDAHESLDHEITMGVVIRCPWLGTV